MYPDQGIVRYAVLCTGSFRFQIEAQCGGRLVRWATKYEAEANTRVTNPTSC